MNLQAKEREETEIRAKMGALDAKVLRLYTKISVEHVGLQFCVAQINQLLAELTYFEVEFKRIIMALNMTCKSLLSDPIFVQQLIFTCNQMKDLLQILKDYGHPEYLFCGVKQQYNGHPKVKRLADSINSLISSFKSTFTLSANITGAAAVQGQTGQLSEVAGISHNVIQEAANVRHTVTDGGVTVQTNVLPPPYLATKQI